jgi:hypothetical protein
MSLHSILSTIRQAGLEARHRATGNGMRVEVRIANTQYCTGGLMPKDDALHALFAKGLIDKARLDALRLSAGQRFEIGKSVKVSADEINLVERSN